MKKTSVVIVDDQKLIREMLAKIFAGDKNIKVTGGKRNIERGL